jgi:hypothetical protein
MKRNEAHFQQEEAKLDVEFALFALEHPGWLEKHVPNGAVVVFQTDDEAFNTWALKKAGLPGRRRDKRQPVVLVNVGHLRPRRSRIRRPRAALVSRAK